MSVAECEQKIKELKFQNELAEDDSQKTSYFKARLRLILKELIREPLATIAQIYQVVIEVEKYLKC